MLRSVQLKLLKHVTMFINNPILSLKIYLYHFIVLKALAAVDLVDYTSNLV